MGGENHTVRVAIEGDNVTLKMDKSTFGQLLTSGIGSFAEHVGRDRNWRFELGEYMFHVLLRKEPSEAAGHVAETPSHTASPNGPEHPGLELARLLKERGFTIIGFGRLCGISEGTMHAILKGRQGIKEKWARKFGDALGMDPQEWLQRQAAFDRAHAKPAEAGAKKG